MIAQPVSVDTKIATHEIIFDALVATQTALNAALVFLELTMQSGALLASSDIALALAHLGIASRHVYELQVSEC